MFHRREIRHLLYLAAAGSMLAQEEVPPKAEPVSPALQGDSGKDWYERCKNLYDSAKATEEPAKRKEVYARAIEALNGYLAKFQNHENTEAAMWYLGESYVAIGKEEDARRCYRNILKRGGKSQFTMVAANQLAVAAYKAKQFAEAAPLYEKMAEAANTPANRLKGLYFAAVAYGQVKNGAAKAAENYRKVIADTETENPFRGGSQLALGNLLVGESKFEEALPFFEQAASGGNAPEVRGPAALQAAAVAAKLGKQETATKFLELVLTTPGMESARASARFALMAAYFDRKEYEKVAELYRADPAAGEGEQAARRLMLAARATYELKQYKEAAELLQKVAKHPDAGELASEAAYLRLLANFRAAGKYDLAEVDAFLERYRKGREDDPRIQTALLVKAEALLDAGKAAEAAKAYQGIKPELLSPDNRAGMLYNRARSFQEAGDEKSAATAFGDFISGYPKDKRLPQALFNRARAHQALGNTVKALSDFDALVAGDAADELKVPAYLNSAQILTAGNKWGEAVARYRNFLEKFPKAADDRKALAHYGAAVGLLKTEKVKEALPHADAARKLDAKTFTKPAGLMIAAAQWTLQDTDATGDEVEVAIRDGYVAELQDGLVAWAATRAFHAKRHDRAIRFFQLVANAKEPEKTPKAIWRLLGKAQLATGDAKNALVSIERALAAEDHPVLKAEVLVDKGKALLALDRPDDAMAAAVAAEDLRPQGATDTEVRLLTGDILWKKNEREKAIGTYAAVVEFGNAGDRAEELRPRALQKLATALEQTGQKEKAEKYSKELKEKFPGWKGG